MRTPVSQMILEDITISAMVLYCMLTLPAMEFVTKMKKALTLSVNSAPKVGV